MHQPRLFFEDFNEALREVVRALGGAKVVGALLWPEKTVEAAQQLLLACLNDSRAERLTPDQVLFLLREGRRVNCHGAMQFIAEQAGYSCQPIEPEDERAKLQREFIDAAHLVKSLAARLEKLPEPQLRAVK